jgi:amino acid transporter
MTGGIGILAVGGIVYAAILYSSSSQSADQTKKAKDIIRDVVIGIIAYASMYLLLNFLIPGGIFT